MSARRVLLILAGTFALAAFVRAQSDHAVPRSGGGGGSSDAGARHTGGGGGVHSSSGGSDSSPGHVSPSGSGSALTDAQRRHPRAGTGRGGSGGYYPGWRSGYYPGGWYYPGYWGYWWPYGSYGWYGGYWGYPWGWGGGTYHYVRRDTGSVRVLVDPAEARVYVDGYYAGTVDDFDGLFQRLNLSPGRHEITLKLEGYKTHRMKVYVAPDATLKLHFDMQKGEGETFEDLAPGAPESEAGRDRGRDERAEGEESARDEAAAGRLHLTVRPEDASVYVDGAFRGSGRQATSLMLPPGEHRIEVVRPGFRTIEREVEITPGETTDVTVELEKPSI